MVDENNLEAETPQNGDPAPQTSPERKEVDPGTTALVKKWIDDIKDSTEHHAPAFKRMRQCMDLAAFGTSDNDMGKSLNGGYVIPITNRLVNQAVATLYAKNPTAVAKRKEKLLYTVWDGAMESLQAAQQAVVVAMSQPPLQDPLTGMMAPAVPDPQAMAIVKEVEDAKQNMLQMDRMAQTLKVLFRYYLEEQDAGYKEQLKAWVRRAKVCGVAYIDLEFQRTLRENPDIAAQISDTTKQIASLEGALLDMKERPEEYEEGSAKLESLKIQLEQMQEKLEIIVREGPVLSFPRSTEIIPSKECRHLKTFAGSPWVAREYNMSVERVQKVYGIDIKGGFTPWVKGVRTASGHENGLAKLWRVQDKERGQEFVVCDGYNDFIVPPREPDVKIERFWTVFALVFNEIEHETEIFPPSDVWNVRHMQRDYNSAREGVREHRRAAKPRWATPKGKLTDSDRQKLMDCEPFEVIEMNSLGVGEDIKSILQPIPVSGVDPNLYETASAFEDIQRGVGMQEANLGGTGADTATESSIAEQSRSAANASDVDDLDTVLTALARAMGQLMFQEISKETVLEIAGPGAIWPDAPPTREQISKDLILEIEAGSSGRPNKAAELANFERAMPYMSLLPNVNPTPLARKGLALLDIDLEEGITEGAPSIAAMNQMAGQAMQAGGGPDAPNQQGGEGESNQQADNRKDEPGGQPAYPGGAAPGV